MRSRSTCTNRSVSASRTRSPTVGPNISAYWRRESFKAIYDFTIYDLRFAPGRMWRTGLQGLLRIEASVDLRIEAVDFAQAGEGDQFDAFGVAGFETHRSAGRNVQPKTT